MQKLITLKLPFLALILFMQSCTANPKSNTAKIDLPNLIPYRSGKLWGYCDKDKKIKIKPDYDNVSFFNEFGLAQVFKENLDNKSSYKKTYLTGVIDTLGNKIIPAKNYNGFKIINYDGGNKNKYGPFDAVVYGDIQIIIIDQDYDKLKGDRNDFLFGFEPEDLNFNPNIILLHEDYKVGNVYNRNGDVILHDSFTIVVKWGSPKRLETAEFYFAAQHKTQKYFQVFDKNGKLLNDKKFKEVTRLNDTLYIGQDSENNLKALYHISGEILFSNYFDIKKVLEIFISEMGFISLVNRTDEALYSLKLKKFIIHSTKYGKISQDGSSGIYKNIFYHNNMLLINYGKDNSEFGLFSIETGEVIVKGYPQMNVDFSFQFIMAKNSKTVHLYDFDSKLLKEFQNVDTVIPISEKHFLVSRDNKVGIWSQQTKTYILDIAFENIDFSLPDVFLALSADKIITVYDSIGNKVFPQQFTKHKVLIEDSGFRGCWPNFRNLNNKYIIDINPFPVFSGTSQSMQYRLSQEGNINNRRGYRIINFLTDDYDRVLKEIKKEIVTVVLEDSAGNRYRLMPDYSLKPLPNEADLVYRIMDVYFYGKSKFTATFFIDGNNKKHIAKMTKIEYSRNQPLMIIESGKQFYAFDPETSKRSSNTFEYLEIKYINDAFYYYGISGNQKLMLSSKMEVIQKFPATQEFVQKLSTYTIYSTNPDFLIDMFLVNNKGKKFFNNTCMISLTSYNQLVVLVSCNKSFEQKFLGYANINGTKYFD